VGCENSVNPLTRLKGLCVHVERRYLRHYFENMASPLTPAEFTSLRKLAETPHADDVPSEHRTRLMQLGLTVRVLGITKITSAGRERLSERENSHGEQPRASHGATVRPRHVEGPTAINWTVSHPDRLVVATAKDELTVTDFFFCVDGMKRAGVSPYRKIYDMTLVGLGRARLDLRSLGKVMAEIADNQPFGPVAIVVASDGVAGSAQHFEERSGTRRPVQIFRDRYAARAWLDEILPPDQVPEVTH
jgi:hypothetical protein